MFYCPELGRFLARDMIPRPADNLNVYAGNNSVNHVDPTGLYDPDDPRYTGRLPAAVQPPPPIDPIERQNPKAVWLCHDIPDIPCGKLAANVAGKYHDFLKVDGIEMGMGAAGGGVPGDQCDCPGTQTTMNLHPGRSQAPSAHCVPVIGVDHDCVKSYFKAGTPTGPWIPLCNDCNTVVQDIITKCTPHRTKVYYAPLPTSIPMTTETGDSYVEYGDGTKKPPGPLTGPPIYYPSRP